MNESVIKRSYVILDQLRAQIGADVPLSELATVFSKKGDPIGEESVRVAAYYLRNYTCPWGFSVHVSQKHATVRLELLDLPSIVKRRTEYPDIKSSLGVILWDWMLNIRPGNDDCPKYRSIHQDIVATKLANLRNKNVVTTLVDGGSTTSAAIRALLDVDAIPIRPTNPTNGQCRFITPVVVTNALSIAAMVAESKHADRIDLRLMGGTFRPNLSSICGFMTDLCLQAWGNWRSDVAVIGTTGCWPHPSGYLGFACEDAEEAALKAKLLQMGFFRAVIFDSSKLRAPHVGHQFAPLSSTTVDLIVIDDGERTGAGDEVESFCNHAKTAGVAVVILKTEALKQRRSASVSSCPSPSAANRHSVPAR